MTPFDATRKGYLLDEHGSYYPNDWDYLDREMSLAEFKADTGTDGRVPAAGTTV